jgi:hypothetical protein
VTERAAVTPSTPAPTTMASLPTAAHISELGALR